MKKILMTGSKGRIGKILTDNLKEMYSITEADLPRRDIRKYSTLKRLAKGKDAIIHLAWYTEKENWKNESYDPDNSLMFQNVYKVALEQKVPKVIMPSSLHVHQYIDLLDKEDIKPIGPHDKTNPDSPYGANKVFIEELGKYYAKKGLEVVCIRYGSTGFRSPENSPNDKEGKATWFSSNDLLDLIETILKTIHIPNNYLIINGISNNDERVHDYKNSLGWKPKDNAGKVKSR
ncbi:MAG: NAD-dependent epimerase/dehydratase family protein [Candidatus Pacearchaeota archaeon]